MPLFLFVGPQQEDRDTKEPEKKEMSERDKQIAKQIEGFNKDKRSETLIDMHTKERKRKAVSKNYLMGHKLSLYDFGVVSLHN